MDNLKAVLVAFLASAIALQMCTVHASLSDSCYFNWGADCGGFTGQDSAALRLNKVGGSGITSKISYMYGSVSVQMKLVPGNSAGTVTTFYLSSTGDKHDEVDFEFLGNATGQPYTIHTNIFTQGVGQREQQFKPWFNPSDGYHNYTIQWTPFAVVWLIDSVPIRVFRNFHDSAINFPDAQPMKVYSSLWNAENWATQGGRIKTDWSLAPFEADLKNYKPSACYCPDTSSVWKCASHNQANWWTNTKYYQLSESQFYRMKWLRDNYMIYNYCKDNARYKGNFPKECYRQQN